MYLAVLFVLQHSQKKPANPWGAKDAGSFFIKFYFCTVLIFLGFGHFFLLRDCVRSTQLAHLYVSNALPLAVPSSSELTALLPS